MSVRKFRATQSFNNGSVKGYVQVNCDDADIQALVGLMPDGVEAYEPAPNGTDGTKKAPPSNFMSAHIVYGEKNDTLGTNSCTAMFVKKAKEVDITTLTALLKTNAKAPNGKAVEFVTVKQRRVS